MTQTNLQETTETQYNYILNIEPRFPGNLFRFKEYNAPRVFAAFLLLTSFIYFIWTFVGLLQNNHQSYSTLGAPNPWVLPLNTLFRSVVQILHTGADIINIIIIATPLIIAFFFAWTIFDPRNVATYILSLTNFLLGFLEILSPVDFVPDFIPVVGSFDDTAIGGGLITYGGYLLFQALKNKERIETVIELMNEHSEERALQLLLAQQGVSIQRVARD